MTTKLTVEAIFENVNDFDYSELIKVLKDAKKSTINLIPIKKEK